MKYNQYLIAPATASTTGFATSVTGATFTLTANTSGDSLAHKVTVTNLTATDHSGKTLTFVGLDPDGRAQSETIAAPAGSATVTTTNYYSYLTSVTPSATIGADTFSIGWPNTFVTKSFPINWRRGQASLDLQVTGTLNWDLNQTYDDIQFKTGAFSWSVKTPASEAGQTGNLSLVYLAHPKAIRIKFNSYSAGATMTMSYTQLDY